MLFIQKTMRKYIISIQDGQPYPFDGVKEHCQEVVVRKVISFRNKEEQQNLHRNLHLLLSLKSSHVIRINRILEHKSKHFILDYQYLPEHFKTSARSTDNSFLTNTKEKIMQLCQELSQKGVKIELKMDDIGLTAEGEVKIYILPTFQVFNEYDKKNLLSEYQAVVEKMFEQQFNYRHSLKAPSELSDYSYRLDRKITQLEDKINRRKRKKSKGLSSPQRESGSHSSSDQHNKKAVPGNPGGQCYSSKLSNGSITSEKTRYSLIEAQKMVKPKIHKSSFNDFTTTSHKLNESVAREDSLKKRFEIALQKTQEAFKIYDKHFKRNRRL